MKRREVIATLKTDERTCAYTAPIQVHGILPTE